jgi:hypothetical protein
MKSGYNHKKYVSPAYEADEKKREQMTFNKPFQEHILEGGSHLLHHSDTELVAILSSN